MMPMAAPATTLNHPHAAQGEPASTRLPRVHETKGGCFAAVAN